jgi:hypothetical protein
MQYACYSGSVSEIKLPRLFSSANTPLRAISSLNFPCSTNLSARNRAPVAGAKTRRIPRRGELFSSRNIVARAMAVRACHRCFGCAVTPDGLEIHCVLAANKSVVLLPAAERSPNRLIPAARQPRANGLCRVISWRILPFAHIVDKRYRMGRKSAFPNRTLNGILRQHQRGSQSCFKPPAFAYR